ncbi:MAG: hypothetical protein Q7W56_12260 [Candidatus Latescibacteria bacterium]|nr:hypothetical protein [Candidatus Latescibacterota bacterium]
MKRAMHAVALLLILASALTAQATSPTESSGSAPVAAVSVASPVAPPANDLVHQYGDPDDAITGNRGNTIVGGTSSWTPPASTSTAASLAQWLISVFACIAPTI